MPITTEENNRRLTNRKETAIGYSTHRILAGVRFQLQGPGMSAGKWRVENSSPLCLESL
jgi:hypothetical protein